jgi:hypothetical protein
MALQLHLAIGLSGGGVLSACLYLVGSSVGRAMALATAPSWSLAGLVHPLGGGHLCHRFVLAVEPPAGQLSAHHHHPQHQEWRTP